MFRTHVLPIVLGITLALLFKRLFIDQTNDKESSTKYENAITQKIKETRERWKWIFENRESSERVQQLTGILSQLNMTVDQFIEIVPKIKCQVSTEMYGQSLQDSSDFSIEEAIEAIKEPNFFVKDVLQLKGMLAILRLNEGTIRESDEEWIRNLEPRTLPTPVKRPKSPNEYLIKIFS